MSELVSIIVPVYNTEKYLNDCIESITNQSYKNLEILLVDDGSTDNSGRICDCWAKKDKRIVAIHTTNKGQSEARNLGLEIAQGAYVGFVDSDDCISKSMYDIMIQLMDTYNADISCTEATTDKRALYDETEESLDYSISESPLKHYFLCEGHSVWRRVYRKELFNGIRFRNIRHDEDVIISYEVIKKCHKSIHIKNKLYYWNQENLSLSRGPVKTLDVPSKNVAEIVCQEVEDRETCDAAIIRYCQSIYRMITRANRYGFLDDKIEAEFNNNLENYLSELYRNKKLIKESGILREIDKLQIGLMVYSYKLFRTEYSLVNLMRKPHK